jgi:hypothetical protein
VALLVLVSSYKQIGATQEEQEEQMAVMRTTVLHTSEGNRAPALFVV